MKNEACTVNGYTIHLEVKPIEGSLFYDYTYWVSIGREVVKNRTWKTLKGVINWCEKH